MIDFGPDQLLNLALGKYRSGHYEEALQIADRASETGAVLALRHELHYLLGKKAAAEADLQSAVEHFKACSISTVGPEIRIPAQERCRLLNAIFKGRQPITAYAGTYLEANVKSTVHLAPDSLLPEIWFVGATAAYRSGYDAQSNDSLSRLIRLIKHDADPQTLARLGQLLADYVFSCTPILPRVDYVVPVPTSPDRWNERGYRIPNRLASEISGLCSVPLFVDVLETVGDLPELRHLPRWYRSKAIEGSYAVKKERKIAGRSLLVVDDVITTGSTVSEVAKTLLDAGASEVAAVSLCHTERSG